MSVAPVEPDALPFPGARQVFDTRNPTTCKQDSKTTRQTRFFPKTLLNKFALQRGREP